MKNLKTFISSDLIKIIHFVLSDKMSDTSCMHCRVYSFLHFQYINFPCNLAGKNHYNHSTLRRQHMISEKINEGFSLAVSHRFSKVSGNMV